MRSHCHHDVIEGHCRLCWLEKHDPRYGGAINVHHIEDSSGYESPCKHRGRELIGTERQARNLDHARRWLFCLHEDHPLGDIVCSCKGCGPLCPKYEASNE